MYLSRIFWALTVLGGTAGLAMAQKSPEETVKSMTVADGLQVELFAAEPMVINPTSMDVDHLGRVWVCEAVNYRRKMFNKPMNREAGDRVVILTDKDGDGKADESTIFYQGPELYGPLGIAVAKEAKGPGYKVFVCQSPDILLFEDKDGDGKANGPPKKFLTGFGGFDHDHGVHGINIGPDGRLYFTVGDAGLKGVQASDGKGRKWVSNNSDCQGGTVWRCNMDGTNLELIAHNFRNNYECCVNSFGEIWLSDNDDDGNQQTRICQVMPGGNYGYFPRGPGQSHWHEEQPGIVHKTMRTGFGSPTGICFYEGTLLPKKYQGQLLHTDAGPRELRCFHIKPKGAGYELEKENLVTSTDNWFRLSDVCVAPDGSLMLADWYDPGVGGHGMGDWTRGRIYRVTPKGHKGYKIAPTSFDSADGARAALQSPCLATRAIAFESLRQKAAEKLIKNVFDAAKADQDQQLLARCLWVESYEDRITQTAQGRIPGFAKLKGNAPAPGDGLVRQVLDVVFAVTANQYEAVQADEDMLAIRDSSPVVRAALLTNIKNLPADRVKGLFAELAGLYDGQDIFYRAALNIACGTDPARRDAILADFDKYFPEWNDKVADLVWELRPKSVLPRLGKLLEDPKLTPAQKGRIVDILAVNDDPQAGKTLISLLSSNIHGDVKSRALENLRLYLTTKWKGLAKSPELTTAIDGLLKDDKTKNLGLHLIAAAGATERVKAVGAMLLDQKHSESHRKEAIVTLSKLRSPESVTALGDLMTERGDPLAPQAALALGALIGQGNDPVSKSALERLQAKLNKNDGEPAPLLQAILSSLAGSRAGTQWLLKEKEEGRLRAELVSDTGRLLRNSPFQGERNKALMLFPAGNKLDPKKLPAPAELAKRSGDTVRGEKVFAASFKGETQCMRCHMVRGTGGQIGPDLSMIGKKASKENLYDSLLTPSKAIADQYLQWKVVTADGKSISGLLVEETKETLTLRDANGKDYRMPTADIDSKQKSLVSLMPDNLIASFTEDELVDVVEYLFSLKTPSLTPDSWNILGPFANDDADSGLDKDLGLEAKKSIDLTETLAGKDGKVNWKKVKVDGAGYIDLTAHHGDKAASSASYLYRVIESPVDQKGTILFGNDDGAKVWVNGTQLFENRDHFAAMPGRHKIPVTLKKGPNPILIKIVNGNNPHGFYFTLSSDEELKAGK